MELNELLIEVFESRTLIKGVVSNKAKGSNLDINKIDIKPVLLKSEIFIQFTNYVGNQVLHENLNIYDAKEKLSRYLESDFKQMVLFTKERDYQVLVSKKGKVKIISKEPSKKLVDISHNRQKQYILKEGTPYSFLTYLGVMTEEGKVKQQRYDKFKQLNRYLELVEDVVGNIDQDFIRIIDFGCGKAYLTFALYHYLVEVLNKDVEIIGLDLKENVIQFGNETAKALGYDKLKFLKGDIQSFNEERPVDMVISLHACDTATDDSLVKGIQWGAKVIMAVPCCQHELFGKVKSDSLNGLLKYGIYKERISALLTDALRASLLEQNGYKVDAVEFISLEHTAKNIMLRAVKSKDHDKNVNEEYDKLKEIFGIKDFHMERNL
ncbi:MAG: SAM-dependent methyltransferase [Bacillota bacterium]|nr:SAM-dependent methyltransferase [Bacillota bacterium]